MDATFHGGAGILRGQRYLNLPSACVDYPEELVLLVRHPDGPPFDGAFMLYGAERSIR